MQVATSTTDLSIEEWLKANTAYCFRFQARMSPAACMRNRSCSRLDLRCEGCEGLFDQPSTKPALRLVPPEHLDVKEAAEDIEAESQPDPEGDFQDEICILDDEEAEDEDLSLLDELDIGFSDEELETILPGFLNEAEKVFTEEAQPIPEETASDTRHGKSRTLKVAVFIGRCHRCGGYMMNDREHQYDETDEEVYRCFSCGWRVSPVYSFNRKGGR